MTKIHVKRNNANNDAKKGMSNDALRQGWRLESGPQFGIPIDVAPLTGIRLTNTYFTDATDKAAS